MTSFKFLRLDNILLNTSPPPNTHRVSVSVLVAQSCLTLCYPMDCDPPGPSVHGIFQVRILEWVTMSSSSRSLQPRDWTCISHIAGIFFTFRTTKEAPIYIYYNFFIHLSTDGHLSFSISCLVNNVAIMNMGVKKSLQNNDFVSFGYTLRIGIASYSWVYTPRKPDLKETCVPQCSSQHCL